MATGAIMMVAGVLNVIKAFYDLFRGDLEGKTVKEVKMDEFERLNLS